MDALRNDSSVLLRPSLVVGVSHLIGYWVTIQPLGELLGQALDGGAKVNDQLWHPFREPRFHAPAQVRTLYRRLVEAFQQARGPQMERDDWDWYRQEIGEVLRAFRHASERGECIVSVLEPPADADRAGRARVPFVAPGEEPEGSESGPEARSDPERAADIPSWSAVGAVGGCVVLGVLHVCYWRYRRMSRRT